MNGCTATSRFDIETMSRGRYWFWRTNPRWWAISSIMGIMGVLVGTYLFVVEPRTPAPWLSMAAGFYFLLRYWISGFHFRRTLKKHPQFNSILNWTFDDEGLRVENEYGVTTSKWNAFLRTYTVPDGFLLYPQKAAFNWIPCSAFKSEGEAHCLEEILRRKTRNKKI
jgi:hypothetical protein